LWPTGLPMPTGSHWPLCHRNKHNFQSICWKFSPCICSSQISPPPNSYSEPVELTSARHSSLTGIYFYFFINSLLAVRIT
jgi:hypothetical protein